MHDLHDPDLEKNDVDMSTVKIETASYISGTVVDDSQTSLPSVPAASEKDTDYPEGGWPAWFTVAGSFLALVCTFGQLTSFGTFQAWYSEHQLQSLPPSTISWIGSMQLWVFFFSVSAVVVYGSVCVLMSYRAASWAGSSMNTVLVCS